MPEYPSYYATDAKFSQIKVPAGMGENVDLGIGEVLRTLCAFS